MGRHPTDFAEQLGSFPTQVLPNQPKLFPRCGSCTGLADVAHKNVQVVFEEFRQVLTCEIVEQFEQEEESLREFLKGRSGGERRCGVE